MSQQIRDQGSHLGSRIECRKLTTLLKNLPSNVSGKSGDLASTSSWEQLDSVSQYEDKVHLGFRIAMKVARRVPLVEQELLTLPDHLRSSPVFSEVRVTRSLVLCVCFVGRLSFCTFLFGHCVVCSSTYEFWLPLWYLQILLTTLPRGIFPTLLVTSHAVVLEKIINLCHPIRRHVGHLGLRIAPKSNNTYS